MTATEGFRVCREFHLVTSTNHSNAFETNDDDDTLSATKYAGKTPETVSRAAARHVPHSDDDQTERTMARPLPKLNRLPRLLLLSGGSSVSIGTVNQNTQSETTPNTTPGIVIMFSPPLIIPEETIQLFSKRCRNSLCYSFSTFLVDYFPEISLDDYHL